MPWGCVIVQFIFLYIFFLIIYFLLAFLCVLLNSDTLKKIICHSILLNISIKYFNQATDVGKIKNKLVVF